jgi:hypothetical protein
VGPRPKWATDYLNIIHARDNQGFKSANIINKILTACKDPNVS